MTNSIHCICSTHGELKPRISILSQLLQNVELAEAFATNCLAVAAQILLHPAMGNPSARSVRSTAWGSKNSAGPRRPRWIYCQPWWPGAPRMSTARGFWRPWPYFMCWRRTCWRHPAGIWKPCIVRCQRWWQPSKTGVDQTLMVRRETEYSRQGPMDFVIHNHT